MIAGIPISVIKRRNKLNQLRNQIRQLSMQIPSPEARIELLSAYNNYYNTFEEYKFIEICKKYNINPELCALYHQHPELL